MASVIGLVAALAATIATPAVAAPPPAAAPPAGKAPAAAAPASSAGQKQTEQDEYTRYELLAPDTASFKIDYEVTATTPGARAFWNPIRKGSVASDEAPYDCALALLHCSGHVCTASLRSCLPGPLEDASGW